MSTRAVLFDFDGVIAATENVHVAAWQRTLGVMGWVETDETCSQAAEVDDRAFVQSVFDRRKIDNGNVDGWVARKQELTIQLLADSPRIFPGVLALIERLQACQIRLGVVTTTSRANVEVVLRASGLADAFEFVVAKDDVSSPKPHPEGYLLALAKLGLPVGSIVALEDSNTGIHAARSAGVRVVAVGHHSPASDFPDVSAFVSGFEDLNAVLATLGVSPSTTTPAH